MSSGQGVIRLGFGRAVGGRIPSLEMSMTQNKVRKRLVRARASKTGESYSAALRHLLSTKEKAMNASPNEQQTCTICGVTSASAPDRSFVVSDAVAICSSCAQRAGALAERAAEGEVIRMMSPQMHQDTRAAYAWALRSGSGPEFDLVTSWKEKEGSVPITPEQLGDLISVWTSAGKPTGDKP
jgi:hypothetical protein